MDNQNRWNLELDVVIKAEPIIFKDLKTCTVEELLLKINQSLGELPLLKEGAPCRVLEPGKLWQQGKVRIVIEFQPEEPQP